MPNRPTKAFGDELQMIWAASCQHYKTPELEAVEDQPEPQELKFEQMTIVESEIMEFDEQVSNLVNQGWTKDDFTAVSTPEGVFLIQTLWLATHQ